MGRMAVGAKAAHLPLREVLPKEFFFDTWGQAAACLKEEKEDLKYQAPELFRGGAEYKNGLIQRMDKAEIVTIWSLS
tara:strand:+ start:3423 stop:3653 length:231 start_codon:yes stop_codon:yes gene_type:complete